MAWGGDLSAERLLLAYRWGIFPWFDEDPVQWFFMSPRPIITAETLYTSKSMRRLIRRRPWRVTLDHDFSTVMDHCAQITRHGQEGTWINGDMMVAYKHLHQLGHAHSIEVWDNEEMIGGFYGVLVGSIFCGESMFTLRSNASKYAFLVGASYLFDQGVLLIDCQQDTAHMKTLGTRLAQYDEWITLLRQNLLKRTIRMDPTVLLDPLHHLDK
ncbi:MAG: leucyl/phenylalanyl-tRNA--protein transferase [Bacteroidota bacterium]